MTDHCIQSVDWNRPRARVHSGPTDQTPDDRLVFRALADSLFALASNLEKQTNRPRADPEASCTGR